MAQQIDTERLDRELERILSGTTDAAVPWFLALPPAERAYVHERMNAQLEALVPVFAELGRIMREAVQVWFDAMQPVFEVFDRRPHSPQEPR